MIGLAGLALGALVGYQKKRQFDHEDARASRQEKFDQIEFDRAEDEKSERNRKRKIAAGVGAASQEGRAVEIEDKSFIAQPPIAASTGIQNSESQPQQTSPIAPIAAQGVTPVKAEASNAQPSTLVPIASQGIPKSTWQMGGRSFADAESANKAALEYNTPEARNTRIGQAYRENGDHVTALDIEGKASRIKGDAIRTEADQLNLNQAKEQEARLTFGRGMVNAYSSGGGASLMSFLSDSHADGEGGAVKFERQLSPDGKFATVYKTTPKGERIKVSDVPNTEEGWQFAMFRLQKGLDPNALFAHSAAIKEQEWKERNARVKEIKAEADARRADANDRRTDALIAGVIGSRGSGIKSGQGAGLSADDVEKASSTINARVTEIYQPKEGATQEERAALGVARNQAATEVTGIWKVNNKSGNSIDASTALYARDLAKDKNNLVTIPFQGGTYPGVVVNGVPVIVGEKLKPKVAQPETTEDGNVAANGISKPKREAIPAEPKRGEWVGNEWVVNPDHAVWKAKYAPKIQEQNQRITRALDNPFIK